MAKNVKRKRNHNKRPVINNPAAFVFSPAPKMYMVEEGEHVYFARDTSVISHIAFSLGGSFFDNANLSERLEQSPELIDCAFFRSSYLIRVSDPTHNYRNPYSILTQEGRQHWHRLPNEFHKSIIEQNRCDARELDSEIVSAFNRKNAAQLTQLVLQLGQESIRLINVPLWDETKNIYRTLGWRLREIFPRVMALADPQGREAISSCFPLLCKSLKVRPELTKAYVKDVKAFHWFGFASRSNRRIDSLIRLAELDPARFEEETQTVNWLRRLCGKVDPVLELREADVLALIEEAELEAKTESSPRAILALLSRRKNDLAAKLFPHTKKAFLDAVDALASLEKPGKFCAKEIFAPVKVDHPLPNPQNSADVLWVEAHAGEFNMIYRNPAGPLQDGVFDVSSPTVLPKTDSLPALTSSRSAIFPPVSAEKSLSSTASASSSSSSTSPRSSASSQIFPPQAPRRTSSAEDLSVKAAKEADRQREKLIRRVRAQPFSARRSSPG